MSIVAGVDDSPMSTLIVEKAIEEARCRETDVHFVHVVYFPMTYTEVAINWDEVAAAEREAIWGGLEGVLSDVDVPIEKVDLDGYPPDVLVGYADEVDAALLVIGTRGRGELASLILGSTSHRAIHLAHCDVLVVKMPRAEE